MRGRCWEYAIDEFKEAIRLRYEDKRNVWTYGLHFRDEYFPHREMAICYFHLDRFEDAIQELKISIGQTASARAKYYLNQTRRSYLLTTGQDIAAPTIYLEICGKGYLTNQNPFQIKGTAEDDQYVSAISVNNNLIFIELACPTVPFTFPIDLKEGPNTVEVIAKDLSGRQASTDICIRLDQQGPLVIVNPIYNDQIDKSGRISFSALVYDQSGITSFQLNNQMCRKWGLIGSV